MKKTLLLCCMALLLTGLFAGCKGDVTGKEEAKNVAVEDILQAVKDAYGEDYLPNFEMDETMLSEQYGIDMSLVDSYVAEMPAISFHPDRVVIAKAKEGKGDELEAALTEMRRYIIEDSFLYPANMAKANASQVVRNGDYVALLMVGAVDENMEATEEEQLAFAKEEVQKAVDAFNGCFQ